MTLPTPPSRSLPVKWIAAAVVLLIVMGIGVVWRFSGGTRVSSLPTSSQKSAAYPPTDHLKPVPGKIGPAGSSVDEAFLKRVAALPPQEQVRLVVDKLKEINPGYDGKVMTTLSQDGTFVQKISLKFGNGNAVKDLWPILPRLASVDMDDTSVSDLSLLAAFSNLTELSVQASRGRVLHRYGA